MFGLFRLGRDFRAHDSQFGHPRDQGSPRQTEASGGTVPSAHNPSDLIEHANNVFAFGFGQSASSQWHRRRFELPELVPRKTQLRAFTHNHGAFEHVLQFTNIPGPRVQPQELDQRVRNVSNIFVQSSCKSVDEMTRE